MGMFSKLMHYLTGSDDLGGFFHSRPTERQLIQRESEIGGQLFGPVPEGRHRQFFNLDQSTWIWYEEWRDEKGVLQHTTTRYEVHPNGILKVQDNVPYYFIEGQELANLTIAMRTYYEKVSREVYRRDPATAKPLTA